MMARMQKMLKDPECQWKLSDTHTCNGEVVEQGFTTMERKTVFIRVKKRQISEEQREALRQRFQNRF
jgi:hypothetical protein